MSDVKEIQKTTSKSDNQAVDLYSKYIGKYVICRSRNEGINAGVVVELDDTAVIINDARRLHYHRPIDKSMCWYEGVSISGLSENSKISPPTEKLIVEDYSLTICTPKAKKSIVGLKNTEQTGY